MKRLILRTDEIKARAAEFILNVGFDPLLEVVIRPYEKTRTQQQNDWWQVLTRKLANEVGYEHEEMKQAIKDEAGLYIDKQVADSVDGHVMTVRVYRSTTSLKVREFSELIELTYRIASMHYGIVLPDAEARF